MTIVVADPGPLNYLHIIGQLEILSALDGEVLVPPAVLREMMHPMRRPDSGSSPRIRRRGFKCARPAMSSS